MTCSCGQPAWIVYNERGTKVRGEWHGTHWHACREHADAVYHYLKGETP